MNNLNFQPLEVVSRYRDPQLQVGGNYMYSYLINLRPKFANLDRYDRCATLWSAYTLGISVEPRDVSVDLYA